MKKRTIIQASAITLTTAYLGAAHHFYKRCFKWEDRKEHDLNDPLYVSGMEYIASKEHKEVSIESRDGLILKANYYPAGDSKDTVILVHGYHMTGYDEFAGLLEFYQRINMNILLIDQRSHGKSEGKWVGFGYLEKYDVLDWTTFLQENYPYSNLFYHGISMGSATVLLASGEYLEDTDLRGIIADCGFDNLEEEIGVVMKNNHVPKSLMFTPLNIIHKLHYGHSVRDVKPIEAVKKTNIPILYFHGTEDHYVPVHMGYRLYSHTASKSRLVLVKDAEHACSYATQKETYEKEVIDFINTYRK